MSPVDASSPEEWVPPTQYFPPAPSDPTVQLPVPGRAADPSPARRRTAWAGAGLLAALAFTGGVLLTDRPGTSDDARFVPITPLRVDPLLPSASSSPAAPLPPALPRETVAFSPPDPGTRAAAATPPSPTPPASRTPSPATPSSAAPVTSAPVFPSGATVGLAPAGDTGYRVRHRDYVGRLDRISASRGSDLDRADSRFVVRPARGGTAGLECVTFESDNYPGRFLRHRDYALHLDVHDGSALFTADATFCVVPGAGETFALRSLNYPTRYLTRDGTSLTITTRPTAFVVRAPLT